MASEWMMGGREDGWSVLQVQTQHREWRDPCGGPEAFTRQRISQLEFEGLDQLRPTELSVEMTVSEPLDPGAEATKDMRDGVRGPRDSEVCMTSRSVVQLYPPACQAAALTPGTPLYPAGPGRRWGAGGRGVRGARPVPHSA